MKRLATIKANDGDGHAINIKVEFTSNGSGLVDYEATRIITNAARAISAMIPGLPYTDFGSENTTVTINKRG